MAVEYTWKLVDIRTADLYGHKGVITQAFWQKIGKDGKADGVFEGATRFEYKPDPKVKVRPPEFTEFSDVKEKDVLGWIQSANAGDVDDHINEQIQYQIDAKKSVSTNFPWSKKKK